MVSVYINSFGCRSSYWQAPRRREVDVKKFVFGNFPRTGSPCDCSSCLICKNWQNQHTKSLLNLQSYSWVMELRLHPKGRQLWAKAREIHGQMWEQKHCRTLPERWTSSKSAQSTLPERAVSIVRSWLRILRLHLSCPPDGKLQGRVCVWVSTTNKWVDVLCGYLALLITAKLH